MLICPHLRLKKENVLTADDNGLTQIHADEDKTDINNSAANRFDITLAFAMQRKVIVIRHCGWHLPARINPMRRAIASSAES